MDVLDIAKEKRSQLLGEIERLDNFLKTAVELEALNTQPGQKRPAKAALKTRTSAPRKIVASPAKPAEPAKDPKPKPEPLVATAETQPIPDGDDLAVPDYRLYQDEFDSQEPDVSDLKIEAKPNADQITFQYPFNSALFQKILAEHRERHGLEGANGTHQAAAV